MVSRSLFTQLCTLLLASLTAQSAHAYVGGRAIAPEERPGAIDLILVGDTKGRAEPEEIIELCTGTLVAPRWILLAAHCVMDMDLRKLNVSRSASIVIPPLGSGGPMPGKAIAFKRPRIFPGFADPDAKLTSAQIDVADVALIELTKPFPDLKPAPLADAPPARGDSILVGGWGIPAESTDEKVHIFFGQEDLARLPKHLRSGTRVVADARKSMITLVPAPAKTRVQFDAGYDEPLVNAGIDPREIRSGIERSHAYEHISEGDSGGAVYRARPDGGLEVVAVNSLESPVEEGSEKQIEHLARVDGKCAAGRWVRSKIR